MTLRFYPRTRAQKKLPFVPRTKDCGWTGKVSPVVHSPWNMPFFPHPPAGSSGRRVIRKTYALASNSGGIPLGQVLSFDPRKFFSFSSRNFNLPKVSKPQLPTWEEPPGDLFD